MSNEVTKLVWQAAALDFQLFVKDNPRALSQRRRRSKGKNEKENF